ncbi:MAG: DUF3148 domain-containing protein [Cyanobacteria bacterium P01_H01_bin.152]
MNSSFTIGDRVCLATAPPYIKTADTMPMLRPGDLLPVGSIGIIREQKSGNTWAVKFDQGSFLLDDQYLEKAEVESDIDTSQHT